MLLIVQVVLLVQSEVRLNVVQSASEYHDTSVTLICDGGTGQVTFFNRDEMGNRRNVSLSGEDVGKELTIDITVESEGIYYCMVGEERSINEVPLVGEQKCHFVCIGIM